MGDTLPKFTAAAVQAAPVFLDREATIDKACSLIADAAKAGASLIVFPETWVPGYPFWHTTAGVFSGETYADLWKNAVEVPSTSTHRLSEAARKANAYVVIGINERDLVSRGTLYNTLIYFAPDGEILHKHRKLLPTFTERTIWGFGDGSDLAVIETPLGRVGGLICWEHEMTLAKYALYAQGEQVHCSVWPAYTSQNDHIAFGTRQYAFEGACFVVVACGVATRGSLPKDMRDHDVEANGGSAIIGPNGQYLAGPIFDVEEMVYAEIDLERAIREKHSRDVAGHYARPDVFQFTVNAAPKPVMRMHTQDALPAELSSESLEAATAEEVVDRLQTVRDYLGSLISRIEAEGDYDVDAAIAEAMESIERASQRHDAAGLKVVAKQPSAKRAATKDARALMRRRKLPYDGGAGRRHISRRDPIMRGIVKACGPYELEVRGQPYEALLRSILYQQLAGPAAAAIERRLLGLFGGRIPTPQQLTDLPDEQFRGAGVSRQKMGYMRSLGDEYASGRLNDAVIRRANDESVIEMVTRVKGVGPWTADMVLMFCLGRPDVLPVGDLGVRAGMKLAYRLSELPKPAKMEEIAEPWRPYRSVATWYLWRRGDMVTL